ncbi:MAG: hypothetical protein ACI4XM_06875 [Candidatus Coprovivens sp.]
MKIDFTKEETTKLIEEYYKRLESREVKASINAKKGYTGWRDEEGCVTTITVSEIIEIMGMKKEVKQTITEDELKTILISLFNLYDLRVTDVTLNDGLNSRWEGYGMNEHEVKSAFFKGITINIEKKKNQTLNKVPQGY